MTGDVVDCQICQETRWNGVFRPKKEDVARISGSLIIEYTLAKLGAEKFWHLMHSEPYVAALGALSGQQAVQMIKAGLKAVYVSGWQTAADANEARQTYPDQSLYPVSSVPNLVRRINCALQRADQIQHSGGKSKIDFYAPLVADAEAGFGGALNAFELMKDMINAGAAAVHFEDQLGSVKKCGHLGGKVLVPTRQFVRTLKSARLAAESMGVKTILIARTDAEKATLLTNDIDDQDKPFLTGERTEEGYHKVRCGTEAAIARLLAYAPFADVLWMETEYPDMEQADLVAKKVLSLYPNKTLAYNCSPSFNWRQYFGKLVGQKIEEVARAMPELQPLKAKYLAIANLVGLDMPEENTQRYAAVMDKYSASAEHISKSAVLAPLLDYLLERFQRELGKMGYKFQFVTLAGFHALNYSMFELAHRYKETGMAAYSELQEKEFQLEDSGYTAVKHQQEVGTGYFDIISKTISDGQSSTSAMKGSTEEEQFFEKK